jgi:hypothetical protein
LELEACGLLCPPLVGWEAAPDSGAGERIAHGAPQEGDPRATPPLTWQCLLDIARDRLRG